MCYTHSVNAVKKSAFSCNATNREGWVLENPDGNENCVSLWSGASHKDATVCPVKDRAYEVYAKELSG
jgi:hypothetical protein